MKITVMAPVKNEADFIGFSIMSVLPFVHEFVYACAKSDDGTNELLNYIKTEYAGGKLKAVEKPEFDFNVHDMKAYNEAFNWCIREATGDAMWFLHPDMIVTNPEAIGGINWNFQAWFCHVRSFAKDGRTLITKGRAGKWKHIHKRDLGIHYYGGYGSQNEDFYHSEITGDSYNHYGEDFGKYPYEVGDSGVKINHYCECKPYSRRYGKMLSCLETLMPGTPGERLEELAMNHPRVNLEAKDGRFGEFEFSEVSEPLPEVFDKHGAEFERILGRPLIR